MALLIVAFAVDVAGNKVLQPVEAVMAAIKVVGLGIFAVIGLWLMDPAKLSSGTDAAATGSVEGFLAAVAIAVVATASGVIASIFAASRMLAMLTRMREVPHRHLGLPGNVRTHATIYTVAIAVFLTALFDLRQIATLGAIFYLVMDIAIHWGILRHLRDRITVVPAVVMAAIGLDVVVLAALVWVKATSDPFVLYVSAAGIALVWIGEWLFMRSHTRPDGSMDM